MPPQRTPPRNPQPCPRVKLHILTAPCPDYNYLFHDLSDFRDLKSSDRRVARGSFSPALSQNRTCTSPRIRLPSLEFAMASLPNESCSLTAFLPKIPVDAMQEREKHDPFAPRVLPRFHTHTGRSAPVPGFGNLALVGLPLGHLPLHPDDRFPGSLREPEPSSHRLYAGRHVGRKQVAPTLIPGLGKEPGSDVS